MLIITSEQRRKVRERIQREGRRGSIKISFPEGFEDRGDKVLKQSRELLRRLRQM